MKSIHSPFVLFAACVLLVAACKKKDNTVETPTTGTLAFHMHNTINQVEVESYGDTMTMAGNRKIVVTKAQLYLSGFQLVKSDGSVASGPGTNLLKVQEADQYVAGSVPTGSYKTIKFDVGLSAATNASTPSTSDATLNRPEMWFGNAAQPDGFAFVVFQGFIDTTAAANGTNLVPFSYKIGTNANLKTVTMPDMAYTIAAGQTYEEHINIDYANLFNGVQLNVPSNLQINTAADNATPLATQVANNVAGMFFYE